MKNLTILYSQFKKELEKSPHIKVIENRSQFDPPSESYKRTGLSELREGGYVVDGEEAAWLGAVIGLTKGNSMNYHVIQDRQNKGEGSYLLNNPVDFLLEAEPWLAKQAATEADKAVLKRVRVIDQPSVAQAFVGVVMEAGTPPALPTQIVYFRRGHLLPMSLDFKDYYAALPAFMGIVDWQLLYTDVDPKTPGLRQCFDQLRATYEALLMIFPSWDFSLWEERLHARKLLV